MTLAELLSQEWALRALLASTMVGLMCGVLGCFIVLRNMALIGDALAHAILPGVVFAFMIVGYSALGFFTGAVLAGLFAAVGITWIQHNIKTKNDAAIGIVFTAMFSIGVMGISYISRNEGVHLDLKDFLFGNVLGVANEDLYLTAAITVYVLISVVVFYRYLFVTTFQPVIAQTMGISVRLIHYFLMLLLSFAVVASLQTVGVILVVAMLITPASTALLISDRLPVVLVLSAVLGMISAILGLFFAIWLETTPGPAMAVVATVFYLIAALFAPKKGYINRGLRRRKLQSRIIREDILKQLFRMEKQGRVTEEQLAGRLGLRKPILLRHLSRLRKKEWLESDSLSLNLSGKEQANRLVRAHRLWETFLVDKIGLSAEQIHEDAERYEHLLSEELLDELDAQLGFPRKDPHGSPIPGKKGGPAFPLSHLPEEAFGRISATQINEHITNRLWELGLLPDLQFCVREKTTDQVSIEQNGKTLHLPLTLAKLVNVVEEETENSAL
jgi:ABC-type Mn2+/Zn2+ transport system permease subunit/Mn-dependent DtxR family transcriptional regulator